MDYSKFFSQRARTLYGSLGQQTSVPISGLINLGSGTPDFLPPQFVFDAMQQTLADGKIQYTAWTGIPELRAAIAQKLRTENNIPVPPEEILVTSGAQEALMVTLMALADAGDEILTPSPNYDEYTRDAKILGATLVDVPTKIDNNFTINAADLEAAITPKTKAIIVVTPNNPTGTVLPKSILLDIGKLAQERDLLLISDEIYEYYTFDGHRHVSMASLPGMQERTITINSFSKSFAMTGMRLGFIAAPPALLEAMLPFHHAMMICANVVTQYGGLAVLSQPRDWFKAHLAEYNRRRQLWMETLKAIPLPYSEPQGAYYVFIDIRPTGLTSAQFVSRARKEARLVFQPGTIGGSAGEGFIRGALTKGSPEFEEGLARFTEFVKKLLAERK